MSRKHRGARAPIALLTVTLAYLLAGCASGNPQPPAAEHGSHQQGVDHPHKEGERGRAAAAQPDEAPMSFAEPPGAGTKARCPVAKEVFTVTADTTRSEHKGRHYVFCCGRCKSAFDARPDSFTGR